MEAATGARALKRLSGADLRFPVERVRRDFPALQLFARGKPLVYLDNAATSQKPRSVIEATSWYYELTNANVHRGVHYLSERATGAYEEARRKVQRFLNAGDAREIVFLRGTTEAVNLVAQSFGKQSVQSGDEIIISAMEHHSNIVPWQILCEQTGAKLRVAPIDQRGELMVEKLSGLFNSKTRLLAVVHASNSLGTINPIKQIIETAHQQGVPVVVDGAQAAPHLPIDVQELDCDFYAISGHKMFGPTGIGALYGKSEHLERMIPYQGGGEMIRTVRFEGTEYADPPHRFEAGTPNIAGAVGLGVAIDYLKRLDWTQVQTHEADVLSYATDRLSEIKGLRLIGTARDRVSLISFLMDGIHAHDLGTVVDQDGIAIRTGHHCTQPVMDFYGVPATARASLAFYNTRAEIDALCESLLHARKVFCA